MTPAQFSKSVNSLWGKDWRPQLRELLAQHGHRYTYHAARNTFLFWRKGERPIPEWVGVILRAEEKLRERDAAWKIAREHLRRTRLEREIEFNPDYDRD